MENTSFRISGLQTDRDYERFKQQLGLNLRYKSNRGRFQEWFRLLVTGGAPVQGDSLVEALAYRNPNNVADADDWLRTLVASDIIRPVAVGSSHSTQAFLTLERKRPPSDRYAREYVYEFCRDNKPAWGFARRLGMKDEEIMLRTQLGGV